MPSLLCQLYDNGHSLVAALAVSLLRYMGLPSWLRTPGCRACTFNGSSLLFVNLYRSFASYHLPDL